MTVWARELNQPNPTNDRAHLVHLGQPALEVFFDQVAGLLCLARPCRLRQQPPRLLCDPRGRGKRWWGWIYQFIKRTNPHRIDTSTGCVHTQRWSRIQPRTRSDMWQHGHCRRLMVRDWGAASVAAAPAVVSTGGLPWSKCLPRRSRSQKAPNAKGLSHLGLGFGTGRAGSDQNRRLICKSTGPLVRSGGGGSRHAWSMPCRQVNPSAHDARRARRSSLRTTWLRGGFARPRPRMPKGTRTRHPLDIPIDLTGPFPYPIHSQAGRQADVGAV